MQALMLGKATTSILEQIEKLEQENKELNGLIVFEKSLQVNHGYAELCAFLSSFRYLDYSLMANRRHLIDTLIYKVILYEDKVKIIFHLKSGQHKGEVLLAMLFPEHDGENPENEKETAETVSNSVLGTSGSYTSRLVETRGFEPLACALRTHRSTN